MPGRLIEHAQGYSAEFRIPLRVLRFDALPTQDFGLQVRRFIDAKQEYDDWAFYPRNAAGYVRYFGRLEGLSGLSPGWPFDWPGCEFLDTVPIEESLRADVAYNNAAKLLKL